MRSNPDEQVLRLAFQTGKLPSLHPYYLGRETRGRVLANFLFEGLVRIGPKNTVRYAGCKKIHFRKNKTRYLFELRNHCWSDGQKVTALQYELCWKENLSKESDLNLLYTIKNAVAIKKGEKQLESLGVKALKEDLLQVDLERPDPYFLEKLKNSVFFPFPSSFSKLKNFNGPYSIVKENNRTLILEKNPYYWSSHQVFFNKIVVFFEKCPYKIHELFRAQDIDWIGDPCNFDLKFSENLIKKTVPYPLILHFNTRVFPLSSPLIRRAFSDVIDRDFIVKSIFPGCKKLVSPLPDELSSCTRPSLNHSIDHAKKMFNRGLKQLGLTLQTFPTLELSSYDLESHQTLVKYLQDVWQNNFNIRIRLNIQNWNYFFRSFDRGDFQIGGVFKNLLSLDPFPFLESFSAEESNFSHWTHENYIKIIQEIRQATTAADRKQGLERAENFLAEHMPVIPLISLVYSYAHHPKLKDYVVDQVGNIDFRYAFYSK